MEKRCKRIVDWSANDGSKISAAVKVLMLMNVIGPGRTGDCMQAQRIESAVRRDLFIDLVQ